MTKTAARLPIPARRPVEHDLLLAALPHPILVLAEDNRIIYANAAAEAFLSTGIALLKRVRLDEVDVAVLPAHAPELAVPCVRVGRDRDGSTPAERK